MKIHLVTAKRPDGVLIAKISADAKSSTSSSKQKMHCKRDRYILPLTEVQEIEWSARGGNGGDGGRGGNGGNGGRGSRGTDASEQEPGTDGEAGGAGGNAGHGTDGTYLCFLILVVRFVRSFVFKFIALIQNQTCSLRHIIPSCLCTSRKTGW
jgi:hypothetical protein